MDKVLAVQDLHKRFGSGSRLVRANDGITMDVKAGEVVGVLGHNGAGKTTLVNQIVGLYRPHSGSIAVGGVDVVAEPELARRLVSVQAQANVPITGISPRKAIELTGRIRGGRRRAMRARAGELIDVLDMGEWADKLAEKVSGGVARLTAFAMAVAQPGANRSSPRLGPSRKSIRRTSASRSMRARWPTPPAGPSEPTKRGRFPGTRSDRSRWKRYTWR